MTVVTPPNTVPSAEDDLFTVKQNSSDNVLNVLANDSDPDGDALTIAAVGLTDSGGTASTDGGLITYSPAVDFVGTETFTYTVSDGQGGTDIATVSVAVQRDCSGDALNSLLTSGSSEINLDGECRYLVTERYGRRALFDIFRRSNLTINGNGATIERSSNAPVYGLFYVQNVQNMTIRDVTIKGGRAEGSSYGLGGGMWVYGSSLTLSNVQFVGNSARNGGGGLNLYNRSSATLDEVQFVNNTAQSGNGGGLVVYGGSSATISNTRFISNSARYGGGVYLSSRSATIVNAVLADNVADDGAALWTAKGSDVTIENTTITDNLGNPKQAILAGGTADIKNSI